MQRVTKYRLAIAVLGLAVVGLVTHSVLLQRADSQISNQAAHDKQRVSDSERQLSEAKRVIEGLRSDASTRSATQSSMQLAVAAFSRQAEVCVTLKQQLHVEE